MIGNYSTAKEENGKYIISTKGQNSILTIRAAWQPVAIKLDVSKLTITAGKEGTTTPTTYPKGLEVKWSSSDEKIATVENGVVKGISPGSATITAEVENGKATAEVTVEESKLLPNPMEVTDTEGKVKAKKLKKKEKMLDLITVTKAEGAVKFEKVTESNRLDVDPVTGVVTVTKKTKKGTYEMDVKVTAAGNETYDACEKIVHVKVKVKGEKKPQS